MTQYTLWRKVFLKIQNKKKNQDEPHVLTVLRNFPLQLLLIKALQQTVGMLVALNFMR